MDITTADIQNWVEIAGMIIAVCAAIAAITPTKVDDEAAGKIGKLYNLISGVINTAALNIGKAKNQDVKDLEVKKAVDKAEELSEHHA